jgi:predicted site-specific integrase-resolvase
MNFTTAADDSNSIHRNAGPVLLNMTTACRIIGVSTPTLARWILKGQLRGIPSPFAELAAPSTRKYTTPQRLREWFARVSEVKAA